MLKRLDLARVLLVGDELASRLTLQTILQAVGYNVDVAESATEAIEKLDGGEYQLVLSEEEIESPGAGFRVLSHAQVKDYCPATAFVTAYTDAKAYRYPARDQQQVSVDTEDVSALLGKVADLIGSRVQRRAQRVSR
jgi:CheY-like chemotaxis protein